MPLFPSNIKTFVDLFAGGFNVGINATAQKIICNDYMGYLVDFYKSLRLNSIEDVLTHIENRITELALTKENEEGYKKLRTLYNHSKNPLDLYVLICFSFNHQIRFNSAHQFNNPFGRERSNFNLKLKEKLIHFHAVLNQKNIIFSSKNFQKFDILELNQNDFIYCDPPYLISNGSYNDGKRGFDGWAIKEEIKLLKFLDEAHAKKIKFALSNVLEHKGQKNEILIDWANKYNINLIDSDYTNSSYQLKNRDKKSSIEVLITNY
jgi:DNA adenine methylase